MAGIIKKLKFPFLVSLFSLILSAGSLSQEAYWKAGMQNFFDNVESGQSVFRIPQTMAGVMVLPEAGIMWDSVHYISAGVNLLHEFGSPVVFDKVFPAAYYSFRKSFLKFNMGAFPRSLAVERYPRLFFQDSLTFYRPNVNGVSIEAGNSKNYFNFWMDWTGRQSDTIREAFIVGLNGRYSYNMLYVQHFSYMYHFAGTLNPDPLVSYHDNVLFLTSAGIDLSGRYFPGKLDINVGWVAGLERARADQTGWQIMTGVLTEARIEYKFIGLFNSYYSGEGLLKYYGKHGSDLYRGDPFYRAGKYDRLDLYINFLNNRKININFTWALHFLEGRTYHEQLLKVAVALDGR